MKFLRIPVVILLAAALLWGCSEKKYRFVESKNGDYIICKYDIEDYDTSVCLDPPPSYIFFSSLEEMRSDIRNGDFNRIELRDLMLIVQIFGDKDTGRLDVCDLDNMRVPTYPSDCQGYEIGWRGTAYYWKVQIDHQATAGIVDYELMYGIEDAGSKYETYLSQFTPVEKPPVIVIETEEDRNAQVVYHRFSDDAEAAFVEKIYTFHANETEYHVKERYEGTQSTVPFRIRVMYQKDGRYTEVVFEGLSERPSIEYLAQFGSVPEK